MPLRPVRILLLVFRVFRLLWARGTELGGFCVNIDAVGIIAEATQMEHVYVINEDGRTAIMETVICKDEDKELQRLICANFDLLPGDQIDPDAPCRWMLIKREMPVPDPYTGADRWNIDFFFVDQKATPTFVECKRFSDTRSRREVVGQVLEYAANGQYYWSSDCIRAHAEQSAKEKGTTVDDSFRKLDSDIADSTGEFFQEVERRLKAGELRIVFFLEQAPSELKRLVEFLNKQMSLSEVLLVEARQYKGAGVKVVVPRLFGFTEQARAIKRATAAERSREPVATDWDGFTANAGKKGLDEPSIAGIRSLYDACKELGADVGWGRGTTTASFSPKWPSICSNAAPFSVYSNGTLDLHFGSMRTSDTAKAFSERFAGLIGNALDLPADHLTTYSTFPAPRWLPKVESLIKALDTAVREQLAASAKA